MRIKNSTGNPAGYFGFKDANAFSRAIEAELAEHDSHSRAEMEQARSGQPKQQGGFRLRGKPGSEARLKQAAALVGDDDLVRAVLLPQIGERMRGAIIAYGNGRIAQSTLISELVRLSEVVDPAYGGQVGAMIYSTLNEQLGDWHSAEAFSAALQQSWNQKLEQDEREAERREDQRLSERERLMNQELRRAALKGNREDAEQVAGLLHSVDPDQLYAEGEISDEDLRTAMRSAGEMAKTGREASSTMRFLEAMHHEIAGGIGAPGNAIDDHARREWENDLGTARALTVAQTLRTPEQIEANARHSVERDKRGRSSDFMHRLQQEADRMSGLTEHRERLADQAVADAQRRQEERRQEGW